jgi:hypothetical protein
VPQRVLAEPAIGIQDDNDIGKVETEVAHTELQRITFAAARGISANCHVGPCCVNNRSGIISAIIRDHEDAVIGSELGVNRPGWCEVFPPPRYERE